MVPHDKMSSLSLTTTPQRRKRSIACEYCRGKKIKCSGSNPCTNCIVSTNSSMLKRREIKKTNREWQTDRSAHKDRREECYYQSRRKRAKTSTGMSAIIRNTDNSSDPSLSGTVNQFLDSSGSLGNNEPSQNTAHFSHRQQNLSISEASTSNANHHQEAFQLISPVSRPQRLYGVEETLPSPDVFNTNSNSFKTNLEVNDYQNPNWQYHGPSSFISICSASGIDWVTRRTGESRFPEIAKGLATAVSRRLTMKKENSKNDIPEPDEATAWKFCNAYLESSLEGLLSAMFRSSFEARLRLHFQQNGANDDDPAWYALRNTVYAWGYRIELSRTPCTLADAQKRAWRYFEKALSVYNDILFYPSSLMGVEAVAAMSFYVEGLGEPGIEYMLCASAARLAQSKGLHRQAAASWDLPAADIQRRNWIFWMIYVYDKRISSVSGRPSIIDDNDISCELPIPLPQRAGITPHYFNFIVKHAQISSRIADRLATVKSFRQSPDHLIELVNQLDSELDEWRKLLPTELQPVGNLKFHTFVQGMHLHYLLNIRFAYFGSLMAIHSIFTYPWIRSVFQKHRSSAICEQVKASTNKVVEAARNVILDTKYIEVEANAPVWLALHHPLVSMINVFIYVVKYPNLPTAQSDIALMEIATGHFGRLEFASTDLAFPFTREITRIAREMALRSCERSETVPSSAYSAAEDNPLRSTSSASDLPCQDATTSLTDDGTNNVAIESAGFVDLYDEDWSILIPFFDPAMSNDPFMQLNGDSLGL